MSYGGGRFLLFEHLLHRLSPKSLDLLVMVARRIWLRWNSLAFDGVFLHPNTLFSEAVSACEDFSSSNRLPLPSSSVTIGGHVPTRIWKAPSSGLIKINWDAALNKSTGCIGFGCVARD